MEKISLCMGVMWWWESAVEKYGTLLPIELTDKLRHILLALPFMKSEASVRRLCKCAFCDFFDYDLRVVCALMYLLGKYGLRIEMSDEELQEYEGNASPRKPADGIDWEQRRWELATRFIVDYYTGNDPRWASHAIKNADKFIEAYKKTTEGER